MPWILEQCDEVEMAKAMATRSAKEDGSFTAKRPPTTA
jgi:hypothetical protein